jgi:WD40 repeat protein/tetratricopeptide (TPR) repeat protein
LAITGAAPEGPLTLQIIDTATGNSLQTYPVSPAFATRADFSPDGRQLVAAMSDYSIRVWDLSAKRVQVAYHGHSAEVTAAVFSPDGRWVASAARSGPVRVWNARTGADHLLLRGGMPQALRFTPDGRTLLASFGPAWTQAWDLRGSSPEKSPLPDAKPLCSAVAYSPNGEQILTGEYRDFTLRIRNADTGQVVGTIPVNIWGSADLAWHPGGRLVAVSALEGVQLREVPGGKVVRTLAARLPGGHLCFDPTGRRLAVSVPGDGVNRAAVRLWDLETWAETILETAGETSTRPLSFSSDGKRLLAANGEVKIWDTETGREWKPPVALPRCDSAAFLPKGRQIILYLWATQFQVWDPEAGRLVRAFRPMTLVSGFTCHPDGQRIAAIGVDGTVRILDLVTGLELLSLRHPGAGGGQLKFSPDGRRLAYSLEEGRGGGEFAQWEVRDGPTWTVSPREWHGQQAAESERTGDHFAAAFHQARLAELGAAEVVGAEDLVRRGHGNEAQGRLEDARADYDAAVRRDPGHAPGWESRGQLRARTGDPQGALGDFTRYTELLPNQPAGWFQRASVLASLGKWAEAAADYGKAVDLGANQAVSNWEPLALTRLAAGDRDGYRAACREMARRFDSGTPLRAVGFACSLAPGGLDDYKPLATALDRAAGDKPTTCADLHPLGHVLYRSGDAEGAVRRLTEALKFHTQDGGTTDDWLFLALAHHKLGHRDEARQWLDKARQTPARIAPGQFPWAAKLRRELLLAEAQAVLDGR